MAYSNRFGYANYQWRPRFYRFSPPAPQPVRYAYYEGRRLPNSGGILQREWHLNSNNRSGANNNNDQSLRFTVVSYNVLCQQTLEETSYLYKNCAKEWLTWDYRWNLLSKELANFGADVFCLQEVEQIRIETHFQPLMDKLGFEGVFKKRTGNKSDGCAVYWKKSKFVAEKVELVEYQVPSTFLDRDNVGIVVRLAVNPSIRQITPQKSASGVGKVVVANTHLLFNPGRGDIKLCQIVMLLAKIRQLSTFNHQGCCPVILAGDFNSLPMSPLYSLITEGELAYSGMPRGSITGQHKKGGPPIYPPLLPVECKVNEMCECFEPFPSLPLVSSSQQPSVAALGVLRHQFELHSVYSHTTKRGNPEVTTYHGQAAIVVDYIFHTSPVNNPQRQIANVRNSSPALLQCKRRYALPDQWELEATAGSLPNRTCGSDHLPLAAEFELLL